MNKRELLAFRAEIEGLIEDREALGEYNADSKHMLLLLMGMRELVDHAISQLPKPVKK
jgi:hypothetical protein